MSCSRIDVPLTKHALAPEKLQAGVPPSAPH